eukprot:7645278-Pyramimonas_sp.AAC.1
MQRPGIQDVVASSVERSQMLTLGLSKAGMFCAAGGQGRRLIHDESSLTDKTWESSHTTQPLCTEFAEPPKHNSA